MLIFCLSDAAYLVPYQLVSVGENNYVEAYGQQWANRDMLSAVNTIKSWAKVREIALFRLKKCF